MALSRRGFLKIAGASGAALLLRSDGRMLRATVPTKQGNQRINLHFLLDKHRSFQSVERLTKAIEKRKPDVVCLEQAGAKEEDALTAEDDLRSGLYLGGATSAKEFPLLKMLANSDTRVFFLERFPEKKAISLEAGVLWSGITYDAAMDSFYENQPKEAIDAQRGALETLLEIGRARNRMVLENIRKLHERVTQRYPELKRKAELNVLVNYGTRHTLFHHVAKKSGFGSVTRQIITPTYFNATTIAARRGDFGKPIKLDDESVSRIVLADQLSLYAEDAGLDYNKAAAFANLIARKITLKQFHNASALASVSRGVRTGEEKRKALAMALNRVGVRVPQKLADMEKYLKGKIPLAKA